MFKKKGRNQGFFYHFIKTRPNPSLDRYGSKYYDEMQQLAYNLIRYLKMNDDSNEHSYQGNYNLTYLKENMSDEDFKWLTSEFMSHIPMGELKQLISDSFSKESQGYFEDVLSHNTDRKEESYKRKLINKDKALIKLITEFDEDDRETASIEEIREKLDDVYMVGK